MILVVKNEKENTWSAVGLAWELGYMIAIPLVIFALGGRLIDTRFGTSPVFLLAGILFSIFITSWIVYKKIAKLLES